MDQRIDTVKVMGVLNVTPDSFSDGGLFIRADDAIRHAEEMIAEGADIIDIGGYSSRPGADDIDVETELERLRPVVPQVRDQFPTAYLSIDTFRTRVAEEMLDYGVNMINDITGGSDNQMLRAVARYRAGYIVMHMQGNPQTMQIAPQYEHVVTEVHDFLRERVSRAHEAGIQEVWADPGFGFGKTLQHNYQLLACLAELTDLGVPVTVGLSRKSMFWRPLQESTHAVVPAVCAANLFAVLAGARMLRVHDVGPAKQVIQVARELQQHGVCRIMMLSEVDGP
jgi:dihydropteroate synthase